MPALRTVRALLATLVLAGLAQPCAAQTYPSQNINVIVSFAAGGIADVVSRLVALKLGERLRQNVVVENRGGAGGNLAAKAVVLSQPDGYTMLATTTALAINETAAKNKGFSTDDLQPVAIVATSPDVLAVHPSNPAKDLREFIASGRDKSFTYGSAGIGTAPHIGAEYFFREITKVKSVHVPFTGGGPATQAAVGNHVDAIVLTLPTVTPQIRQGTLRGLGLASLKRNPSVPDVPTYGEMGFTDLDSGSWVGFFVPEKTPAAIVTKLHAEINEIIKTTEAQEKLKSVGFDPIIETHAQTVARFRGDVARWGRMTAAVGFATQ